MKFTNLNEDLLLTCLQLICDEIRDFMSVSATCRKLQNLSLHRSLWAKLYDCHQLHLAFGNKMRFQNSALKDHVVRYLKTRRNLESESPKATSYKFLSIDLPKENLDESISCHFYGRFMFQIAKYEEIGSIKVGCYDMEDSLRLLWERNGEWPDWKKFKIQSCEIIHDSEGWSQMTVLMQCMKSNWLNFRTFRIEESGASIDMQETRSQFFKDDSHSEWDDCVHLGNLILWRKSPFSLIDTETSKGFSFDIKVPEEYTASFSSCSFAGREHIITVFRGGRYSSCGTQIDIYKIPNLNDVDSGLQLREDERVRSVHSEFNMYIPCILTPISSTKIFTQDIAFRGVVLGGLSAKSAIINLLNSSSNQEDSIEISRRDLGGGLSQYRSWVVGFSHRTWHHIFFVPIEPRPGGGLKYGSEIEVPLPDDDVATYDSIFDEFRGKFYFTMRGSGPFGLCVMDFA